MTPYFITAKGIAVDQSYVNLALAVMCGVLGWFAREMWAAVKDLKNDLARLREEIPKTYLAKEDWRTDIGEVKKQLTEIARLINGKADK